MWAIILFPLLLLTTSIQAVEVYKYTDPDGKIYFSNQPLQDPRLRLDWKRHETELDYLSLDRPVTSISQDNINRKKIQSHPVRRFDFDTIIQAIATQENLHPHLLHAVVRAESGYRPHAVSSAGARGLMQLMPATAKRFQVKNILDPMENLRGGARYLRHLLDLFDNDLHLALAAYNAGEYTPALRKGQIPSNAETRRFVRKVQLYIMDEQSRQSKPRTHSPNINKEISLALNSQTSKKPVLER